MEKNLTSKNSLALAFFVATTLVLWVYSVDNISVQNITNSSLRNLKNISSSQVPKTSTTTTSSISDNNALQNYYLVPYEAQYLNTQTSKQ